MSYSKSNANVKSLAQLMGSVTEDNKSDSKGNLQRRSTVEYPQFQYAKLGEDLTPTKFAQGLLAIKKGGKTPLLPVKSLELPFMKGTFKYNTPEIRCSVDQAMYKRLVNAGLTKYSKPTTTMFRSNGTRRGLLNRMSKQLINKSFRSDSTNMYQRAASMLPIRRIDQKTWPIEFSPNHVCFEKLNTKANAGLPYNFLPGPNSSLPTVADMTTLELEYRKTNLDGTSLKVPLGAEIPIAKHAFYWANKFWLIIKNSKDISESMERISDFFDSYPELKTFMLKRKEEKMDRDDFLMKVRPYGSQALPMRMFCMWAISFLEQNLENFLDNSESISAYHFSQFYGGARKMLDHFVKMSKTNRKFFGLSYGDDQIWFIRYGKSNDFIIVTPDIVAMDMNSQSDTISLMGKMIKTNIPNIPNMNFNCFIIALTMAFNHAMHIDGPNVVTKTQSLFSGIPGTTIINIHNSARVQAVFESSINNEKEEITPQNVFKAIARGFNLVKDKLSYSFKGYEGLSIEAANMTSDKLFEKYVDSAYSISIEKIYETGIPLPFLSNKISIIDGEPVCVPIDVYKFGASLVLPANTKKGAAVKSQLERVVGVLFSGGWTDPEFYEFLSSTYVDLRKVEKMKEIDVSELSADEQDVFEILEKLDPAQVPTRDFLFDMNTMDKEKFKNKYFGDNPNAIIAEDIKISIIASKQEVANNEYSDIHDIIKEMENFNPTELPSDLIVPEKMGHGNANTIIQDEIKLKKSKDKK